MERWEAKMKILIIIPVYNEEENIVRVISHLKESAPDMSYLIINDCSRDNTVSICKEKGYNYISLPVNLGIGGGVQAGYQYALNHDYDIAIQMDGDGQHDARYLQNIIDPILKDEADIVIGSRFITKEGFQSSRLRRFGINFLSTLIKVLSGTEVKDVTSGFRAVNKKYIKIYADEYSQDYPEPEAIIAAALNHGRIKEVPVLMHERKGGTSSIHSWKSIYYMIKVTLAIFTYRLKY
jgi:glycosyltransferase involved in cell wall biosynthesis